MKIFLDIDEIIQELSLPTNVADSIVEQCVDEVTKEIYEAWKREASDKLKSTRTDYIEGLDVRIVSKYNRQIVLTGALNNMLERGASPFDMKLHFSKSRKVKYSTHTDKNGNMSTRWYLTIPFRVGTPGIVGENPVFSNIMPKTIHRIMKSKLPDSALKKSEIPSPYDVPKSRSAINIPSKNINFPEYTHRSSIFQGMVKKTAAYGKTTQNTYMTFRRVGEASDPNSWIHSGIKAYDLLGNSIKKLDIQTIAENKVDEILESLGYGN